MMVARSRDALKRETERIRSEGGVVDYFAADVADMEQLRAAGEQAVSKFGRIDTWVNNAGVSIFGEMRKVDIEDDRRLFETNFWGVVNGSRLAVDFMRDRGGALINVGSVVSDRAVPLQGMYSASKHAVMGFTDALRMEIEKEGLPISVTLIKPSAIDTPFTAHARNYMENEPMLPPPVYTPELVAQTILFAAENPTREQYVGGGGRLLAGLGRQAPRWMDWFMEMFMFQKQQSQRPARNREGALHSPSDELRENGDAGDERMVLKHSLYNFVLRHPYTSAAMGALALVGVAALLSPGNRHVATETARRMFHAGGRRTTNGKH
jgi:short-subunit dehydrogenase